MVDDDAIGEGRDVKCGACAHQWFVDPNPLGADFADFLPAKPPKGSDEEADDLIATFEEAYEGKQREPKEDEIPEADLADPDAQDIELEMDDESSDDDSAASNAEGGMIPEFEEMDAAAATTPNFAMPSVQEEAGPVPPLYKVAAGVSSFLMVLAALLAFNIMIPGFDGLLGQQVIDGVKLADIQVRELPSNERAKYVVEGKIVNTADVPRPIPTLHVALLDKNGEIMVSREYNADKMLQPGEDTPFTASQLNTSYKDQLSHVLVELGSDAQLSIRN